MENDPAAASCGGGARFCDGSRKQEIVRVQRGERDVLQRGDDVGSVGYHHVGTRLRDMAVRQRLGKAVVGRTLESEHIALRRRAVKLGSPGSHLGRSCRP